MEAKRMAPVNKIKTYGRSNRSMVNSSVDAINILFAKNKAKVKQTRKRRFVVKELPQRPRGETLLVDDSFHVSTEDTFDKLTRKNGCNKATALTNVVKDNNFSKSINQTNSFYSPIMTRRRKRTASIIEEPSSSICNKTGAKKLKGNKSCSVIPHLLEPTVDKIDISLEVEQVKKHVPNSLSYINLQGINEGGTSSDIGRKDSNINKRGISFDPIFTNTFREKQMIHCSTPVVPIKAKQNIINRTISPITNLTIPEKSVSRVRNVNSDVSLPKNLSKLGNPESTNIEHHSRSKSFGDWKLKKVPKVLLTMCDDVARNRKFPDSLGSIHNSYCNIKSREAANGDAARRSFITLRRRKVLKQSESNKKGKKSKNTSTVTSFMDTHKNLTMSLDDFNSFVDKLNQNQHKKSHSLCDFESFMAQNKNLLGVTDNAENASRKKETQMETPINFVTKRRRRLTDSYLSSEKSSRKLPAISDIQSRRLSLQESCSDSPEIRDIVVVLPKIKVNFPHETDSYDINSLIPLIDQGNTFLQFNNTQNNYVPEAYKEEDTVFSNKKSYNLKDLIVNLTKVNVAPDFKDKSNSVNTKEGVLECSESLFENSDNYVDNVRMISKSLQPKADLVEQNSWAEIDKTNEVKKDKKGNTRSNSTSKTSYKKRSNKGVLQNSETSNDINRNSKVSPLPVTSDSEKRNSKSRTRKSLNRMNNKGENSVETDKSNVRNSKNVSATDFENFFVNVNRQQSGSSKQVSTGVKPKLSSPKNQVTDFDKFENFYIGVTKNMYQLRPRSNESNSAVSETYSENLNQVKSLRAFEDFFSDVMRSTSESETDKFVINNDRTNADTEEDKGQKEVVISLVKSPWRGKNTKPRENVTIERPSASTENDLQDIKSPVKREIAPSPILIDDSHSVEISDIIESSLQESSHVDHDGFRIPTIGNVRRRHSKTLLLKAGKLWRRSLSIYRRSSMMLGLISAGACIARDGSYCVCAKCNVSRESKQLTGRCSIKVVPTSPAIDLNKETSILESYAHRTSYVSDQILEDNLENNLRSLSLSRRRSSVIQNSAPVTARELVLRRCGQSEPIQFEECYPKSVLHHCQKIGEGVYGEVFLFRNPNGGTSVMKVIPIEGDLIVNGERQKKFEEIFSEIIIAQELSNLRNNKLNTTGGFAEVQKVQCVQGRYPEKLLDLWELYDETRGSENDSPEVFGKEQVYIVLQLANGGQDLEAFIFNNSLQAYTMFQQVACSLAIAEEQLNFEHRDLHWGNVLLSSVDKNKNVNFRLDGKNYEVPSRGVEVSIIDFTLSRIEYDGVVIFNDLGLDPDLFTAEGDYQFEIYKLMQKKNGNNWQRFEPYTNILWLHYILDKAVTALRYKNVQSKIHREYVGKLKQLKSDILNYASVKEFVLNHF